MMPQYPVVPPQPRFPVAGTQTGPSGCSGKGKGKGGGEGECEGKGKGKGGTRNKEALESALNSGAMAESVWTGVVAAVAAAAFLL